MGYISSKPATVAQGRSPFAGVVFGVSGGVLEVVSIYGMAFSRIGVGVFSYILTDPPANYACACNQVKSVTQYDTGNQVLAGLNHVHFYEGGIQTDPSPSFVPSSILFFEV